MVWLGWVSVAVLGCVKTIDGEGAQTPQRLVDPGVTDPVASFQRAKSEGSLDPQTCQRYADAFDYRFQQSGAPIHRFNAGVVWEACNQPQRAAAAYQDVVRVDPEFALAHNNLGTLAYQVDRVDEAIGHYQRALKAQPTAIPPRHNLAHIHRERYLDTGRVAEFDNAQRRLQEVLAVDSDNLEAYEGLARLYYDRAQAGERSYVLLANLVITQAQRREQVGGNDSAELWNLRGLLAVMQREPTRALQSFEEAITRDPDHVDARLNAALIELELRNFEEARENLEVAAKLAEGSRATETALALGVARRGLRDYAGAEQAYARAKKLSAADPRALYNMGVLYQDHIGPAQDSDGLRENEIARERFQRFLEQAGAEPRYAAAVASAKTRVANIDEYEAILKTQTDLEAEVRRLEALERREREKRRKELLELERDAQEALKAQEASVPALAD